jgi:hypothetical protein
MQVLQSCYQHWERAMSHPLLALEKNQKTQKAETMPELTIAEPV